jgi:sucrose-6-phosphate hydrolase SacC (GH32 family)
VAFNHKKMEIVCGEEVAPCKPVEGKIKVRILVDRTSLEIFINGGRYFMPVASIPDEDNTSLELFAEGGDAKIISLEVNELNSIWK